MAGRTPQPESPVKERLEQEQPETRRPGHRHRRSGKKRRERDAGEKVGLPRWPRTSWNRLAPGFLQMRILTSRGNTRHFVIPRHAVCRGISLSLGLNHREIPRSQRRPRNDKIDYFFRNLLPTVLLACAALLLFSSPLLAQTPTGSQKAAHTGDLTGVWYPSSVNTFNFIWTDAQGQHLNALPLTPWGQEKFKGNHPIGGA